MDIKEIVERAVVLTEPRWKDQALSHGIELTVETEFEDLLTLDARPSELREALINLIFNAIDAMPEGGTITIRGYSRDGQAVLEVCDTGVGMPDAVRRRCFDPFFTTQGESGSGLGLTVVYGMVQRHNGSIALESTLGEGTRVIIHLPGPDREAKGKPDDEPGIAGRHLSILVVDDEPMVRRTIRDLLTHDGHTVHTAGEGTEALETFKSKHINLVGLDRAMPGMNGDLLASKLHQVSPATPVIMLTGFGDLMTARRENPAGVDLVLGKPLSLADLRAALAKVGYPQASEAKGSQASDA